jgi:tight adherence protein C
MIYLIAILFSVSVMLVILVIAQLVPARSGMITRRLAELEQAGASPYGQVQRRERQSRRSQWEALIKELGDKVGGEKATGDEADAGEMRRRMMQAGYTSPTAPAMYWGGRISLVIALAVLGLLFMGVGGAFGPLIPLFGATFGWVGPSFFLDSRIRRRQKEIRMALPDALDLLVTSTEAGLGLNQGLVRIAEEIRHVSTELSKELAMVNFEIRAGRPREEALRNLGNRTGVEDLRQLATMLIQTDRFGTSVAQALRVQSDTLRTRRRQRAEEAAAKTVVKILFPLVFCIFPALFVVLLGPAAIQIMTLFASQ